MAGSLAAALPLEEPRRLSFEVYGIPRPKGSARPVPVRDKVTGEKRYVVIPDNDKKLRSWEASVREAVQRVAGDMFFTGAVTLTVEFWHQRPKGVSERKRPFMTTKPDADKLLRGCTDPLTGVVWNDDSQVIEATVRKHYIADGPAGARITVVEVLPGQPAHRAIAADVPR